MDFLKKVTAFLKKVPTFWLVFFILILPGILVSGIRSLQRLSVERNDNYVETVVDFDEFRLLARKDGFSLDEIFTKLKENGASSVAISEDTLASLELEGKITVLSTKEIRKLSLEETYEIKLPDNISAMAGLWVFSEDVELLDRINQNLLWKINEKDLVRVHRNLLLINKSGNGFMDKVGLGFSKEYFNLAEKNKMGVVVKVFNYPGLTKDSASKIIDFLPPPASVSALLFADEEMLGERGELNQIIELFKTRCYRIGWIEFDTQEGIKSYLKILSKEYPFIRVHSISRKEMDQIYTPKKAIERWVRAVKDRSLKKLYFRCFQKDDKKFISNWTEYNLKYLRDTVEELKKNNFLIAEKEEQRLYEPRRGINGLTHVSAISLCIALILGVALLLKLSYLPNLNGLTVLSFAIFSLITYILIPATFQKVAGVIGAISYSCIGYLLAIKFIKKNNFTIIENYAFFLFLLIFPSIVGGFLIVGLYSNSEYLLRFDQFYGVKLAFVLPLIFTVAWSFKIFRNNFFDLLNKPMTIISFLVLSAVVGSLFLYIIRSDNTTLFKATAIEEKTRSFLENTLVARPRNKEFLVGYPAAMLFVMFFMHKNFIILPLLALFIQMGQVSVVNTFCHFHTRLGLSLLRVANGLWLGILIGCILVILCRIFLVLKTGQKGKTKSIFLIGYFGFNNAGDELLRETFTNQLIEKLQDYTIRVLVSNYADVEDNQRVQYIRRKNLIAVLEELMSCQAIVIPGGGVFQSITSCKSLLYYLFLIWLGKKLGAKIILPAQGLGPWKNYNYFTGLLHKQLAKELKNADYLTVRDNSSLNKLREIISQDYAVDITTDLAFLNRNFDLSFLNQSFLMKNKKGKIEFMNIYAVLRSSVKGSLEIAQQLIQLANESENIDLIPVAFQPIEDSEVWLKAGWTGEIRNIESFDKAFNGADLVISMRLHGCILSTVMGIPWIGLSYDPKVSSFADNCDWSEFCHNPDEADEEFFENSINKLAFHYSNYSEKLSTFSKKMQKLAEKDFTASCEVITKVVVIIVFLLLFNPSVFAQNNFPSWMDDVSFERSSSKEQFGGPVDPETGKTVTLESKINKKFKPKLPDFSNFRKEATVISSDTNSISESSSSKTIQNLKDIPELSTATTLLNAVNQLASETINGNSLNNTDELSNDEYRRRRTYKPGRFKSFYLESKEAQKKKMEETNK